MTVSRTARGTPLACIRITDHTQALTTVRSPSCPPGSEQSGHSRRRAVVAEMNASKTVAGAFGTVSVPSHEMMSCRPASLSSETAPQQAHRSADQGCG